MKFPISNHPLFGEKWNDFAQKFNHLADIMEEHGLGVSLLREVVDAAVAVEELSAEVGYKIGFMRGVRITDNEFFYTHNIGFSR